MGLFNPELQMGAHHTNPDCALLPILRPPAVIYTFTSSALVRRSLGGESEEDFARMVEVGFGNSLFLVILILIRDIFFLRHLGFTTLWKNLARNDAPFQCHWFTIDCDWLPRLFVCLSDDFERITRDN